ncbi:MAG: T9SS type A sorting domain-containing protein [Bacteroidales bacterium]|nr:T9SS type A sorting domain-containing protein [Bacteroidales bacterium]
MKRLIILFFFWMIWLPLWGQQIVQAEYFIGEDPGYGNATPIAVTAGADTEMNFIIPLSGLDFGIHTLYARVKDSNGKWSQTFRRVFLVQRLPLDPDFPVTKMEYFFDDDPGFGQGTPIEIQAGANVTAAVEIPLSFLAEGMHTLYVRTRDSKGSWGLQFYRTFLVQILPQDMVYQVNYMEYFFDEDPGFGQGTPIAFQPGEEISVAVELPLGDLTTGMHTLYVRTRDDKGSWGLTFYRIFLKFFTPVDVAKVVRMEYFVNSDPGPGNGTPVALNTPRLSVMKYFVVEPELLQPGTNTLYVRALDTRGRWGLVYYTTFEALQAEPCDPPTELTANNVTEATASLGWTEQGQATTWDLLWVPSGMDYTEDGVVGADITANPNTVENLFQATLYDFYVRSACTDGQVSPWAGPAQFHTLPLPYNQLSLLADPPNGGTLTGEGSYAFGETITITATPNTNFVFQHWSGDTNYLNDTQETTAVVTMPAAPITLTAHFLDVTNVSELSEQSLRIFPNPARDLLNVEFYSKSKEVIIQLMNISGQIVDQTAIEEPGNIKTSFNTAALPAGLYLLVIRSESLNVARKVVIRP